eukprot:gnl/Spiro4/10502_TR5622_c0_g15_i1.p1 gnl/Spiro4/10502_TR5622_c0_g15~~gnl/Spiro4/10502_TR5622_c0_g15_i1.p1  ORF type:complete len:267 (-),score=36.73 gnl/Spiro4/10502_TR5622_c0_g15_i1:40-783(-)
MISVGGLTVDFDVGCSKPYHERPTSVVLMISGPICNTYSEALPPKLLGRCSPELWRDLFRGVEAAKALGPQCQDCLFCFFCCPFGGICNCIAKTKAANDAINAHVNAMVPHFQACGLYLTQQTFQDHHHHRNADGTHTKRLETFHWLEIDWAPTAIVVQQPIVQAPIVLPSQPFYPPQPQQPGIAGYPPQQQGYPPQQQGYPPQQQGYPQQGGIAGQPQQQGYPPQQPGIAGPQGYQTAPGYQPAPY